LKEKNYIAPIPDHLITYKFFKMKQAKSLLAVATIIIMGMVGCSKGSTGPAGPAGPAGPDSVLYSSWITLKSPYTNTDSLYDDTLTAPSITKRIIDSGVILSYIQYTDANNIVHIQPMASLGSIIFEDFTVGKINLASPNVNLTGFLYRYVVIPGSKKTNSTTPGKVKGYTPEELKAMSYEQAQQVLTGKN
jgi:hypothetical protein